LLARAGNDPEEAQAVAQAEAPLSVMGAGFSRQARNAHGLGIGLGSVRQKAQQGKLRAISVQVRARGQ